MDPDILDATIDALHGVLRAVHDFTESRGAAQEDRLLEAWAAYREVSGYDPEARWPRFFCR